MSGRTGFQSWTGSNYKHTSESYYHQDGNYEEWWDNEPSSVAHVTQVFHNQSLKNTAGNDWDAWDGDCTPKTVFVPENYKAGNYGRQDDMWQSGASGQYPDRFGQQGTALESIADDAPTDMKIPFRRIGLVIGKGGSQIRELQESSGAKINVKKNEVDASGMVPVTIEGNVTSRINAKRMIVELMDKDGNCPNTGRLDDYQGQQTSRHFGESAGFGDATVLTVASNMIGAVIGRGGRKIREIQDRTQTNIKIDKRSGEVTINGTKEGREQAKSLIDDVIQSESETGYTPDSERSRFMPNSEGSHFVDFPTGSNQRSGFGNFNNSGPSESMVPVTLERNVTSRINAKGMVVEQMDKDGSCPNTGRFDDYQGQQTSRHFGDSAGFGDATVLTVASNMIGAVIGRGGQKIREIQDRTQTKINIDKRSGEVTISGTKEGREQAKSLIDDVIQPESETGYTPDSERSRFVPNSEGSHFVDCPTGSNQRSGFGNFNHSGPSERSFGDTERSSFGTSASRHGFGGMIDWDQVKELSRKHEEEKWQDYPPIKKNFYIEDAGVANMDPEEVAEIREQNNKIMVSCDEDSEVHIPNPVRSFDEGFLHYPEILSELKRAGFSKPSPIQMQGWPIALQGLDLIGIAQTGTGKTLAFLLPAFIHIEGQPVPRGKRGGPNVLVLSPTRELALQVSKIIVILVTFIWITFVIGVKITFEN